METRSIDAIVWREDLYPRLKSDPKKIQEYAENLSVLPPIEINQHNEIIDGYHRWTAHRAKEQSVIAVEVTETSGDGETLELAIERNSKHGFILSMADKKRLAQNIYKETPVDLATEKKKQLEKLLSVTERTLYNWLSSIDNDRKAELRLLAFDLFMRCESTTTIGEAIGKSKQTASTWCQDFEDFQILDTEGEKEANESIANFEDEDFEIPLYDIWNYASKSNEVEHYGNTEARIVENLLYTFTEPFDIVVDPFAGGGSTIDICKKRFRRYWVSDRKPTVAREKEIRKHDIVADGFYFPEQKEKEISLVYLDPPYWKQAAGKYSDDPTDLANMPLDEFTDRLTGIIEGYGDKLQPGSHIACITSPTQWPNDDKHTDYHDLDLSKRVRLQLVRRAVCPYSTQQYNGTQVNIAKEEKLWMVISRTLLVWRV
jgi:hypothetical protein